MKKLQTIAKNVGYKAMEAGIFFAALAPVPVLAQTEGLRGGINTARDEESQAAELPDVFQTITNVLLFLLGAIAVIMLVIGGFRYVVSGGDSSKVEGAKNTILYAIVGIVVAFLAYAAVNFVLNSLQGAGSL